MHHMKLAPNFKMAELRRVEPLCMRRVDPYVVYTTNSHIFPDGSLFIEGTMFVITCATLQLF